MGAESAERELKLDSGIRRKHADGSFTKFTEKPECLWKAGHRLKKTTFLAGMQPGAREWS